jgi:hypothetical protein
MSWLISSTCSDMVERTLVSCVVIKSESRYNVNADSIVMIVAQTTITIEKHVLLQQIEPFVREAANRLLALLFLDEDNEELVALCCW